jgi:hypothetical protein
MVLRVFATLALCASCAATSRPSELAPTVLFGPRGEPVDVRADAASARATVLVFFSPGCHCLDKHEARLRALYETYAPRGVRFLMVDSETGASPQRDEAEARARGYAFPIVIDRDARLADQLGAEYASLAVVVDSAGRVRYRGGIDSDKTVLHEDATFFLRDALDDLLAGRDVRIAESKALGCALRKW